MKEKKHIRFIFIIFLFTTAGGFYIFDLYKENKLYKPAVTYTFSRGRFGDNLLAYLRAKWISYKYDIPIAYKPFPHAEQLKISQEEKLQYNPDDYDTHSTYTNSLSIESEPSTQRVINVIPYFPETISEINPTQDWQYFQVNWKDSEFQKQAKHLLTPLVDKNNTSLSNDHINIAIHIRTGVGFDTNETRKSEPLKFPPISYYASQCSNLIAFLNTDKPLRIRIFTDHPSPELIRSAFLKKCKISPDLVFIKEQNQTSVVDDFSEMMQYKYLIRPQSNFSIVASLIHNYKIVISPKHSVERNNTGTQIITTQWEIND